MTSRAHMVAALRTAVVPHGGAFRDLALHNLVAPLVAPCLAAGGLEPDQLDELILSTAIGPGGNSARVAALAAGLPRRVAGLSIDRQCAGGLDAIRLAQALVKSGQARAVLAGGAESWSRRPVRAHRDPAGGPPSPYEQAPFTPWPDRDPDMTAAAADLAARLGIDRDAQDAWAVGSHARARAARAALAAEIVDLPGHPGLIDPFARALTPATAARARVLAGSVTAATTAPAADGAALCLIVDDTLAARAPKALPLGPGRTLGDDPMLPGLAPIAAIRATLAAAGRSARDLDAAEIMEAYAAQAIACVTGAGLDPGCVNCKGGALARGHPIGASGAVLAVRLFHDLSPGESGLAAIASAGGIGTALLIGG